LKPPAQDKGPEEPGLSLATRRDSLKPSPAPQPGQRSRSIAYPNAGQWLNQTKAPSHPFANPALENPPSLCKFEARRLHPETFMARSTGRSRSFLATEAISAYLDDNEWQISGIVSALSSLDHGEGIPHERVKQWLASWQTSHERPSP